MILFRFSGGFSLCSPVLCNTPSTQRVVEVGVVTWSVCLLGSCLAVRQPKAGESSYLCTAGAYSRWFWKRSTSVFSAALEEDRAK